VASRLFSGYPRNKYAATNHFGQLAEAVRRMGRELNKQFGWITQPLGSVANDIFILLRMV
jgi:hypothetical protein